MPAPDSCLFRALVTGSVVMLASSAAGPAAAQDGRFTDLGTITLIGTGLPTEVMRNPAAITVIDGDALAERAPVSVAGLLRDVPGVQISEDGLERVAIRGETSRRVTILIDGRALTDHTTYGQPVLIDPTQIERIEVVRGSSSVVSGSRAIGGVVNIATKTGDAGKPFALTVTGGYMSATAGYRLALSGGGTVDLGSGQLDYRLSFGRMDQGDRRIPGGVLTPSGVADRNRALHLGYRIGNHYFGLKAQAYDLAAETYTGLPGFTITLPRRDLRKTSLFYEGTNLTPWLDVLRLDAYRQTIDREFTNDTTTAAGPGTLRVIGTSVDAQETRGLHLRGELRLSAHSRTALGLEYEDDRLTTRKLTTTTMTPPGMPAVSRRHDRARIRTLSFFGQHEIDLSDRLTASLGARWYDVKADHLLSTTDGVANPLNSSAGRLGLASAGLVWSPTDTLALRVNVSQGYVYPTLAQLFLTTTGYGTMMSGNPNLRPERATTFEVSARYSDGGRLIDATLFHSDARDYIASVITGRTGTYRNVDKARSWGLELHAEQDLGGWGLTAYGTATAIRRQLSYATGVTIRDSGTPAFSGRIGLRKAWERGNLTGNLDLFVQGETRVRMRDDAGALAGRAAGYGTLNLRADVDLGRDTRLVAELLNLTNRRYEPFDQFPGARRSINLFLTKSF